MPRRSSRISVPIRSTPSARSPSSRTREKGPGRWPSTRRRRPVAAGHARLRRHRVDSSVARGRALERGRIRVTLVRRSLHTGKRPVEGKVTFSRARSGPPRPSDPPTRIDNERPMSMYEASSTRRRWLARLVLGALTVASLAPAACARQSQHRDDARPPRRGLDEDARVVPRTGQEGGRRPALPRRLDHPGLERRRQATVWDRYYGPRNAANFGIGGDRTQHVLWRLENGELDGIKPKVVVLMIGTNNAGRNTADEIAEGVKAIVKELREKLPETKVLLLGVFPRGAEARPDPREARARSTSGSPSSTTARRSSTSTSARASSTTTARSPRRSCPTSST